MAFRLALLLMLGFLSGCAGGLGQTFTVHYLPFSSTPDEQGQATIKAAISFAKTNPLAPVTIDGFRQGQYSNSFDTMADERVRKLLLILVDGGISRDRIEILGKGIDYAKGSPMPTLPADTVKIGIGL